MAKLLYRSGDSPAGISAPRNPNAGLHTNDMAFGNDTATTCIGALPPDLSDLFSLSESLLPVIVDAITDGFFVADSATRQMLFANAAMCRLAGLNSDTIANHDFADLLASTARADGILQFNAITNATALTSNELLLQRPDKSVIQVRLSGAPLTLNEHSLVVGIIHDVSQEHRAQANLRESEQTLRTVIESVSDGIIVHALDNGAIVDANPRACEMFGYTHEELLNLDIDTLTAHPSPESHTQMLEHTARAASGEAHVFDWLVRAKDAREFWVEVGLRRVTLGSHDYLLSTAHDITAHKRAGDALTYRDRLLHATTLGTAALVAAETLDDGLQHALRIVGEALGVDRALIIAESGASSRPTLHSVWEHPSVPVHMTAAHIDSHTIDRDSVATWLKPLRSGEQVVTHIESASADVQELMASLNNKSMLLVPIFVGGDYWGNIGLDACNARREWNTTDAEVLRTFASVIGIAILRNRTQLSLKTSEAQLSEALNMAKAGGWEYDVSSDLFTFNDHFYRVFRTNSRAVGGYRIRSNTYVQRFVHPMDGGLLERALKSSSASGSEATGQELELRVMYGDGYPGTVLVRLFTIKDALGQPLRIQGVTQDITDRKRSEEALRRANRSLLTLSVGTETLVRSHKESEFLERMCEILVDIGGYQTSLIGFAEHDKDKTVRLAAIGGAHRELFESEHLTWNDVEAGRGPIGVAIRTGKVEVNRDFRTNPNVTMWRRLADELSYESSIALPLRDHSDVFGVLAIYAKETDAFNAEEVQLLTEFSNDLSFGIVSLRSKQSREDALARLRGAMISTVQALASTLERRDPYTAGHQRAVAKLASAIATRLHVPSEEIDGINLAATIHDIGKIQIPTEILSKPGKLTPLEHQIVQTHAQAGYEIVQGVDFPWPIAEMIFQHHERLDGSGYPRGLKGSDIILGARIIAVADVIESMISHRPYRPALGLAPALAEIERGRGTLYDDAVVDVCIHLFRNESFSF